jgi:hypothetical protein
MAIMARKKKRTAVLARLFGFDEAGNPPEVTRPSILWVGKDGLLYTWRWDGEHVIWTRFTGDSSGALLMTMLSDDPDFPAYTCGYLRYPPEERKQTDEQPR